MQPRRSLLQGVSHQHQILYDTAIQKVFADDAFKVRDVTVPVPHTLGVHDCYRTGAADPQALDARSQDTASHVGTPMFLQASFQKIPRDLAFGSRRALAAANAQEDVSARGCELKGIERPTQRLVKHVHRNPADTLPVRMPLTTAPARQLRQSECG